MLNVFVTVLPIFFIILSGLALKKMFIRDSSFWSSAETLTYYFLLPCLLVLELSSVEMNAEVAAKAVTATVLSTVAVALLAFAMKLVFKIENTLFTSLFQGSTRYNSYVFLGMSASLFGSKGMGLMGLFVVYMIVLTNFLSILVMNQFGEGEKRSLKNVFTKTISNPLIVSVTLGVAMNIFKLEVPTTLSSFMKIAGGAAAPLSLMAVGAGLNLNLGSSKVFAISVAAALKLIAMPLVTLELIRFMGLSGDIADMALLYSTLPTAGNAYILARQMGGDAEAMASIITLTILSSVLTVSFFIGNFSGLA